MYHRLTNAMYVIYTLALNEIKDLFSIKSDWNARKYLTSNGWMGVNLISEGGRY